MQRVIEVEGRELVLVANGATPYVYKRVFRRDLFQSLTKFMEKLRDGGEDVSRVMVDGGTDGIDSVVALGAAVDSELIEFADKLAFVMAMQGEKSTNECLNLSEGDFIVWITGFSPNAMLENVGDVIGVYMGQANGTSALKKSPVPPSVR